MTVRAGLARQVEGTTGYGPSGQNTKSVGKETSGGDGPGNIGERPSSENASNRAARRRERQRITIKWAAQIAREADQNVLDRCTTCMAGCDRMLLGPRIVACMAEVPGPSRIRIERQAPPILARRLG